MERFVEWEKRVKLSSARKSLSSVQERPLARERKDILLGQVKPANLGSRVQTAEVSKQKLTSDAPSPAEQTKSSPPPTLQTSSTKAAETLAAARTSYYDSWDKFDVEKALEELDQKQIEKPKAGSKNQTEPSKSLPKTTATEEKEKGNAAFKKGDYKKAIEHYTLCMKLDPTNAVYPINRAMALLKLERFAEVEEDCTTGLGLDPKNVKALWRRGIARRSLGKLAEARLDFETALRIEPTNKPVKDELTKLGQVAPTQSKMKKPSPTPTPTPVPPPASASTIITTTTTKSQPSSPGVRSSARVPIVEVDSEDESTLFTKVSKNMCKPTTPPTKTSSPPPLEGQSKVAETKSSQTSGISLMPSSVSALAKAAVTESSSTPDSPSSPAPSLQKASSPPAQSPTSIKMTPPTTLLDFQRDWKSYSRDKNLLYQYLKLVPPQDMPGLFKSSFESDYFSSMLPIFKEFYIQNEPATLLYDTLKNLANVQRFGMALMFVSKSESQMLTELFQHLSTSVGQDIYTTQDLSSLAAKYKVKLT